MNDFMMWLGTLQHLVEEMSDIGVVVTVRVGIDMPATGEVPEEEIEIAHFSNEQQLEGR